jgi:hypothetical protein
VSSASKRPRALCIAAVAVAAAVLVCLAIPRVAGLGETWRRIGGVDLRGLGVGVGFQVLSLVAYGFLFQGVHVPPGAPIRLRHSYLTTMPRAMPFTPAILYASTRARQRPQWYTSSGDNWETQSRRNVMKPGERTMLHRGAEVVHLQGQRRCERAISVCLPCRRSWVRVPSAASKRLQIADFLEPETVFVVPTPGTPQGARGNAGEASRLRLECRSRRPGGYRRARLWPLRPYWRR